jgi:hypothetical protein
MLRFLEGDNVDLMLLARNAGTSVQQLQRFYLSHIEPEMKLDNLLSVKKRMPIDMGNGGQHQGWMPASKPKVLFVRPVAERTPA